MLKNNNLAQRVFLRRPLSLVIVPYIKTVQFRNGEYIPWICFFHGLSSSYLIFYFIYRLITNVLHL